MRNMAKIKIESNGSIKDKILVNAAELFRKKGFAAASVRELAEALGIEDKFGGFIKGKNAGLNHLSYKPNQLIFERKLA